MPPEIAWMATPQQAGEAVRDIFMRMAKMRTDEVPPDNDQEYQAPVDIPNEEEREEEARALALLKELIHDRWEMRHLKWFRPQMRMLIGRAKELRHD